MKKEFISVSIQIVNCDETDMICTSDETVDKDVDVKWND